MRIPAVVMPCVPKVSLVLPPGKDSPRYSVLKDTHKGSCPPVQGCEVQTSLLKEPPHPFPILLEGAEPHRKRGRDGATQIPR